MLANALLVFFLNLACLVFHQAVFVFLAKLPLRWVMESDFRHRHFFTVFSCNLRLNQSMLARVLFYRGTVFDLNIVVALYSVCLLVRAAFFALLLDRVIRQEDLSPHILRLTLR